MTRTEGRLADALAARAAAVAPDSIRPLPAPHPERRRRHFAGRRWSVSLAPLAAAASIATITAVVAMLPAHHAPGRVLTGMPKNSSLFGVAAVSASDAWAVGVFVTGLPRSVRFIPLIMHWNGTRWTRASVPAAGKTQELWGVAAASARDAWAVGDKYDRFQGSQPAILHWNGAEWTSVATPRIRRFDELSAVSVVSATDAWAVGDANGALILHWNGTRWQNVQNPWLRPGMSLQGVSARSADDVWAVGYAGTKPLILHWNGISWNRLGPRHGPNGDLFGVAAVSHRLAWIVGYTNDGQPLIVRWNGRTLRQLPTRKTTIGKLAGVAAASAGQAWAVGDGGFHGGNARSWLYRWKGRTWLRVPSPARRVFGVLRGVSALSAKNAWAVGSTGLDLVDRSRAFILHWNGRSWQAVA